MHCLKEDIAKVGRCCFSQPVFFVVNFVGFKVIIFQILQIQFCKFREGFCQEISGKWQRRMTFKFCGHPVLICRIYV